ncbi:alpha-hydroxynitrile lyase-like [Malania oleifera]|uniref:alpha-hydroxynitrile lyase-like n=1 Tax=Malania oleifera TaxID=397392 RepID=UPI0025ADA67A|nr:alpha-hydroxynitrile lyase-like [Malania oleifera]
MKAKVIEMKHFVLVHGACHGAWIWYKFKPMLESAGHKVTAFDLAASGIDMRPIEEVSSVDAYTEPLLKVMASIPEEEKVILVGDSMGGINAAIAMDKYPHKIALTIFVNAFIPDTIHKPSYVLDKYMENPHDWADTQFSSYSCANNETITTLLLGPEFMLKKLYQQSPVEDYELVKALTRRGSFFQEDLAKREKFTDEGYGSVTRVSIIGEEDKAISAEFQRWMNQNSGVKTVYTIEGGDHMLMFSKPQEMFDHFLEIAATYA